MKNSKSTLQQGEDKQASVKCGQQVTTLEDYARETEGYITLALSHPKLSRLEIKVLPSALLALIKAVKKEKDSDEVSTIEAANILNVSRPYVIKQIEKGVLSCRYVGSHRRLKRKDVIALDEKMRGEARKAVEALTEDSQKWGLF